MAVKRLIDATDKEKISKRDKAKKLFKESIDSANTVAELKKCLKRIAAYVFGDETTVA